MNSNQILGFAIDSPTAMLVYKIMDENIQILNKTVPIAITLHVNVLIAGDEANFFSVSNRKHPKQSKASQPAHRQCAGSKKGGLHHC